MSSLRRMLAADMFLQVGVSRKGAARTVRALEGPLGHVAHHVIGVARGQLVGERSGRVAVLAQQMAIAVRLGGEKQRAMAALEGLLSGVRQHVATQ